MLESLLIIWLVIGFVVGLLTFSIELWKRDYFMITLEDLLAFLVLIFGGPLSGIMLLLSNFIDLEDIKLFEHYRQD